MTKVSPLESVVQDTKEDLWLLEYIVRKCLLSVNKKLFDGIVFQQR